MFGTFFKGVIAGAVGLGAISWLVAHFTEEKKAKKTEEEEE